MISKENKLFEEIDKPLASKTISKDEKKGIIERQSSWTGQIKGIRLFPSGTTEGKGNSKIFANGITISDWQGIFSTEKKIPNIVYWKGRIQKWQVLRNKDVFHR